MPASGWTPSSALTRTCASCRRPPFTMATRDAISLGSMVAAAAADATGRPQQCLNFLPLAHGQGSLRPGLMRRLVLPIVTHGVAERGLQRLEPRRKILPLLQAFAVDPLADLLGARGAHAAAILV